MRFAASWRDYQQRVLDDFDTHVADQRVHLIAAPGSGKTVLGLEIIRRLGRRALVLAPTNTIRAQWESRLVALFLDAPPAAADVSRDLAAPGMMTVATYQGLHALAAEGGQRLDTLLAELKARGPVTLVLDEAHHLRREWWAVLQQLVSALPDAKIVSLTATPPYDAPLAEWSRYAELCGPVDFEIGVPELVRNGDLCPHQDHVILSAPASEPLDLLERRRDGIAAIVSGLRSDTELLDLLEQHPWLQQSADHAEAILEAPELLSAILVHLAASGRRLPSAPLRLLGVRAGEVPAPSPFWTELLLNALLHHAERFDMGEDRRRRLRAMLGEHGMIEGAAVRLGASRNIFKLMAESLTKLDSIVAIAREEAANLGPDLRMVILTDHVRAGEVGKLGAPDYLPPKLGVVPIFEIVRRAMPAGTKLGVLTGNLVIVPEGTATLLADLCRGQGIDPEDFELRDLPGCEDHRRLLLTGRAAANAVELVTALFASGGITILVGTQALLGEGWDAPCVNSLVLASNSAAFMLSNQMRGRAIRIDPERPDKVANIWHLATIEDPRAGLAGIAIEQLQWGMLAADRPLTSDAELLERRFRAFDGIANDGGHRIESSLDRLGLDPSLSMDRCNERTFAWARDRSAIAARWHRSLGAASPRAQVREVAASNYAPRVLAWRDTLRWLAATAASSGVFATASEARHVSGGDGIGLVVMALAGAAALVTIPRLAMAAWLWLQNGTLEGCVDQVARAVLAGLQSAGIVADHEAERACVEVRTALSGRMDIFVTGLSRAGERAVIEALMEVLGPVRNPRYLLARRSLLGSIARSDFHAVPPAIGARKEAAEAFHAAWRRHVGASDLVFTRTPEGRMTLLRARARSFAASFQRRVDRRSAWL
ncbi:DEAD/DEAH box helicase family protein [Sphingomonas sp. LHG3406-1]|uniref:DEAD/DEAH box helicase family protein n=1 Tax=Sphingomonas sp. LHG3406-1 TaxID=2804617 RepID=UPI002619A0B5|nr:DEAD/DEAH box helicase family protein [Sphingomonas sp. LHG3406-1]